jgi:MYXO-CTERM domain-containing protein
MTIRSTSTIGLALSVAATTVALAGPDWQEIGDAGKFAGSAQRTLGVGAIDSISGEFAAGFGENDYEDMYLIRIDNPQAFSITVTSSVGQVGLFLFNVTQANEGFGLIARTESGALTSTSNDGTQAAVNNPGIYAIAIAVPGWWPSSNGGRIFNFTTEGETSGPDGVGGLLPHTGWQGTAGPIGEYGVDLIGCGFVDVPSPGALALGGLGGLLLARRRR